MSISTMLEWADAVKAFGRGARLSRSGTTGDPQWRKHTVYGCLKRRQISLQPIALQLDSV